MKIRFWTWSKLKIYFWPVPKQFEPVQNCFVLIEGQGISPLGWRTANCVLQMWNFRGQINLWTNIIDPTLTFFDPVDASYFQSWNLKANYHVTTSLIALTFTMSFKFALLSIRISRSHQFQEFFRVPNRENRLLWNSEIHWRSPPVRKFWPKMLTNTKEC